jgi:BMFP domain-containing protein YqiC
MRTISVRLSERALLRCSPYNAAKPFPPFPVTLMLDPKQIDDLARRLAEQAPKGLQLLQDDLRRSVHATLEAGLARLDLVTREEFDVQAAVLARSRAKLAALEKRIAALEAREPGRGPEPQEDGVHNEAPSA